MKRQQTSLKDVIITSNQLPPDRFQGADRDVLSKLAIQAWKEREPNAKVLAVRIPSQEWKREVLWRNQTGTWYKIDRSKVQVQVIVQHDAKLAVVRPVNLWKDHLDNNQIKAFPFHDENIELRPQGFLVLDNAKQELAGITRGNNHYIDLLNLSACLKNNFFQ